VPSAEAIAEHRSLLKRAHAQLKGQDHFQVLGLARGASVDAARDAYLELAKVYHPDRATALGLTDVTSLAEELFRRVNEAHAVLTNPEARGAYEQELDGGPTRKLVQAALEAEMLFQKGVVLFRKKNFAEAHTCFRDAYRLNDKEGEHLAWLAWTLFSDPKKDRQANLSKVRDDLLKAIKLSPKSATCHYYLGEVFLAAGDEKRAKECFVRTVEIQESHVEASRHLRLMAMRKEKEKPKGLFGRSKK